jgi:sterol desaturase/sphingolipid hydroxylase (fatty acid hydroxylase superfamily)
MSNSFETFLQSVRDGETYNYMLPVYVSMVFIERVSYVVLARFYNGKDAWSNVGVSFINMLVDIFISVIIPFIAMQWIYDYWRLFTLSDNVWWTWVLVFLIHDFLYYLDHRLAHKMGLFWAFHQVHHSSEEYNLTVAARGFALDGTSLIKPVFLLSPLLGISMFQFAVVIIFTNIWGIMVHTRSIRKIKILEYVFCTPSNHRVHHGTETKYLDRNYGQVLIIWDRIFGSYQEEEEEPTYGLVHPIRTYNPLKIQLTGIKWLWQQIKSADTIKNKLRYLFMPPGWTHDGKGLTAYQLQQQMTLNNN